MESCATVLFLLLGAGGVWAFTKLRTQLRQTASRLAELDLAVSSLRRLVEQDRAAAPGAEPADLEVATDGIERRAATESPPAETAEEAPATPAPETSPAVAPDLGTEGPGQAPIPGTDEVARQPIAETAGSFSTAEVAESSEAAPDGDERTETPAPKPPKPAIQIDWERWIGVRGAAVLGGAVLALAAVLFLKFSIEQGLIPPIVRVALGVLAGLGALGGAEVLRKRAYGVTANALSGAGIVTLYASIWAAHRLYDLIPVPVAFLFLVLVTTTCGLLSWKNRSLIVAALGLAGGFATPFLLASGRDNPIGLFGYILLLDAGLLTLARKRNWPLLATFGLFGTLVYQALWIFVHMGSENLLVTLLILAVFALLFAFASGRGATTEAASSESGRLEARVNAVGGVLLPFAFSFYLAARSDLGEHIVSVASLLLLLSAAACWMARAHKIAWLPAGAAAACVAVVAVWAARTEFAGAIVWEAVGIASVLAAFFHFFAPREAPESSKPPSARTPDAALVSAAGFLFLLLLAPLGAAEPHLWPWVVGWLVVSFLLKLQQARAPRSGTWPLILPAAAAAQVAALLLWLAQQTITASLAWEISGIGVALAVFFHLVGPEPAGEDSGNPLRALRSAPLIACCGFFFVLAVAPMAAPEGGLWPWFAGWVVLAVILVLQSRGAGRGDRQIAAAALFGAALVLFYLVRNWLDAPPRAATFFALALAVAFVFQILALARRGTSGGADAEIAAAIVPSLLLFGMIIDVGSTYLPPGAFLSVEWLLAGLIALSATRIPSGPLYFGAVATLAAAHSLWTAEAGEVLSDPTIAARALALQTGAFLLFSFWPFLAGKRLAKNRWALYASALAGPFWFLSLKRLFVLCFGDRAIGVVPLLLGLAALLAALAAKRLWDSGSPEARRSLVWYLAVTLTFVSVAIPLQLEKEWITVGWALEGAALMALWRRLDHPGLKYLGLALLSAVTLRLILNPAVFGYYPRSGRPIFNWLMYTYLVPVAALLFSARSLAGLETQRLLPWETGLYDLAKRRALGAISCGFAAVLVGFWWINLTVIDYFSVGAQLDLSFERLPARDLSLSLCWAFYALLLLAVGMARRSVGLRWLSLGFLILTIGKVFLYDLGELKDLYRVASLVGLALSLLVVSLAYQRFVFGRDRDREES